MHTPRSLFIACLVSLAVPAAAEPHRAGGVSDDVLVAGLLDEIETMSAKQARVERDMEATRAAHGTARDALGARAQALYRLTRAGRAPVAGGFDAVRKHVARVARLKRLVQRDVSELAQLELRLERLGTRNDDLGGQVDRARERLASVQERARVPRNASGPIAALSSASSGGYMTGPSTFYGIRYSDPGQGGGGFQSQRGALASPVDGELRVVGATREESDGPGLEFQAPPGTAVRAVASGRVAFSDTYGSYGRLVILDHGDDYYTVYGGLGAVEVRVGDDVSRRARLGSVGSDGTPPALFFEVRKGTRTLEPRSWIGL